jgi:hypothetical protein
MENEKYIKKIAQLESLNDQLLAEFDNLDLVLKELGFERGISTLKEAAKEMLHNKNEFSEEENSDREDF